MNGDTNARISKSLDLVIKDLQREVANEKKNKKCSYVEASKHLSRLYSMDKKDKYLTMIKNDFNWIWD